MSLTNAGVLGARQNSNPVLVSALFTSPTAGFGYGTGAGGTATQTTSRTTTVALNKMCGQVTMFSAAGSATAATFTLSNISIAAADEVRFWQVSGTNLYNFLTTSVSSSAANCTFFTTGGTATDAPVVGFSVSKSVTA